MLESSPFHFRRATIWIGRLLLGGIFVYAGISKIFFPNTHLWPMFVLRFSISTNLATFAEQVESYKLLSPAGVDFVAHTLPFAEILLGLLLLIGWGLRIWASLVTLLMLGFLTLVTRAYLLHMNINCGCFATPEPISLRKIFEDGAMAALALLMTIFAFVEAREPHPWSAPEQISP
ncbi:MAG: DoxX family membrane protein [Acidobacteria bacterium Pan2503]|uniref:DoxX family membrane protein n=1 Tax=Candidatus Acidiferrum panamense TaxID=2741543 RepID=A0A7V8NMS8_9BACT|nr:DoxX family membrane protein [Candidatus Acidoferrum panamensis]